MLQMEIKKIADFKFRIERNPANGMNGGVSVYSTEEMLSKMKQDKTLEQAVNATTMPGLVGDVLIMPDGHQGYGFPVGGVAAFDADEGIVSPGTCGYDINCGIRLIRTNLSEGDIKGKEKKLADALYSNVPSGVGSKQNLGMKEVDLEKIATEGADYLIKKGFGTADDAENTEEEGVMDGAAFDKVSKEARSRGLNQLGTLGAGNHFLEVQKVEKTIDEKIANAYGLYPDQIVVMIHTGSRGFGHQVCSDYLRLLLDYQKEHNIKLVDQELSYAYVGSKEADSYLQAMKCAVNFAFSNRQIITSEVRKSFEQVFGKSSDELGMNLLYDLAHNIVKQEEYVVEGRRRKLYIHRKGATRALPSGSENVPKKYRHIGQPVLIPGSMSTASYVLCGADGSVKETFGSACHGSGRVMSRHQALREIPASKTFSTLKSKKVEIRIKTRKLVSEEAEWAYKGVDDVVGVVEKANIAKAVVRNIPIIVIKG